MLMRILNKIKQFFTSERFEEVFQIQGHWKIKYSDTGETVDKYCRFIILKSNKNNYQLKHEGHLPKDHSLYPDVFNVYRGLVEGSHEVRGGKIYDKEKRYEDLSLEECNTQLQQAIADENYELAEKLRKIIELKK